ncbi:hypothetical protein BGZ65_010945, partial [Modicella reniformis]
MDPCTRKHLREWATEMIALDSVATDIFADLLQEDDNNGSSSSSSLLFNSVRLQFQPSHNVREIIDMLGNLTKLKKLDIIGSDIWKVTSVTLPQATKM